PLLLPDLAGAKPAADAPSLLVVGDVDFDAAPGGGTAAAPAVTRSAAGGSWQRLAGTAAEVDALRDAFRRRHPAAAVTDLRGGQPTEEAVRRAAAGCRYLHFATHGYFAPPKLRSALAAASRADAPQAGDWFAQQDVAGFHPGLLSGLVLAGANRPPEPDRDDGVLTALEIEQLDLGGVELATLSACETGLGESASGEGLLGLQ